MFIKMLIILIVLYYMTIAKSAPRRFNLEFYNFTCTKYTTRLTLFECDFLKLGPSNFLFSERFMSDHDLGKDVELRFVVQVTPMNGKKTLTFLDLKFGICKSLSGIFDNPLIKMLTEEMRSTSNFPVSCPLKSNVLYNVANFSITDNMFPQYSPFMNFSVSFDFLEKGKLFGKIVVKGAATPK